MAQGEFPPHGHQVSISVVMAAYDASAFIIDALGSIAAQTMGDFEVLIIDDASTDDTAAQAEAFARHDPRFTVLRHDANAGPSAARNTGIASAAAPWIAFCDADDVWFPTKLEEQTRYIAQFDGSLAEPLMGVGCWGYRINARGKTIDRARPAAMSTVDEFVKRRDQGLPIVMGSSSVVMRRDSILDAGGFREEFRQAEDLDLWTRVAERGIIVNFPDYLCAYRLHGSSLTDQGFIEQMINIDRIGENTRRARRGEPELSYAEYCQMRQRDAPQQWNRELRRWRARAAYRRASVALANRRYLRGAASLLVLTARAPGVALGGLSRQVRQRLRIGAERH